MAARAGAEAGPAKATVQFSPADGESQIQPGRTVTVTSSSGTLSHVDVTDPAGKYLDGEFNADRTSWTSSAHLVPGQNYVVDASAANAAGTTTTSHAGFTTAPVPAADRMTITSVAPSDGAEIGVAYPLVVTFNRAVHNRKEVAEALQVDTAPHVDGAWFWIDAQTVDYRAENFWAPGTVVTLHANLAGVEGGSNLWGTQNTTSSFTVARSQVINVNLRTDRMTVVRDGKKVASYPVSGGKPGWETRDGTKVIMEKVTDKTWLSSAINAPEHYVKHSDWAMRTTDSGEFIHDAPWNARLIGSGENGSHGCVGLLPSDMHWLFNNTLVGDAVVVTGSPRPFGAIWNRIGDWNVSWSKWQTGNYDLTMT